MNNKYNSKLNGIVYNYDDYNFVRILDKKLNKPIEIIERLNQKNIYIYFFEKHDYDTIIFYNKSNKIYRIMVRFDKQSDNFFLINDFLDLKMREYFIFENLVLYNKLIHTDISNNDFNYFDFIKKIDA
jgi:hypothetical protein